MPDLSPAQRMAELQRLNEENEELRGRVNQFERAHSMGNFTIPQIMQMRGIDNPDEVCNNCMGLGVSPQGTNLKCLHCGGSGSVINHWTVLQ